MVPRVLVVAGSDSGGGAGIQADIKTVTALGGYAATAVTALTAQDTMGVHGILSVPAAFVLQQIAVVLDDIGADALKSGMLHNAEIILGLAEMIETKIPRLPFVLDPVMVSTSGSSLLAEDAIDALAHRLMPKARLITPNIPEAEVLLGTRIDTVAAMRGAVSALQRHTRSAILLKGGHLAGDQVTDILADGDEVWSFTDAKIASKHTHGTGCTLASAIATGLGRGLRLADAVAAARAYVRGAILGAPGFGQGHGPLNHMHGIRTPTLSGE